MCCFNKVNLSAILLVHKRITIIIIIIIIIINDNKRVRKISWAV